jgi:hypothetical protein
LIFLTLSPALLYLFYQGQNDTSEETVAFQKMLLIHMCYQGSKRFWPKVSFTLQCLEEEKYVQHSRGRQGRGMREWILMINLYYLLLSITCNRVTIWRFLSHHVAMRDHVAQIWTCDIHTSSCLGVTSCDGENGKLRR